MSFAQSITVKMADGAIAALVLIAFTLAPNLVSAADHPPADLTLILPDRLGPIVIGQSTDDDVKAAWGKPKKRKKSKHGVTDHYPALGLKIFYAGKQKPQKVTAITLVAPYKGGGPTDLKPGMNAADARRMVATIFGRPSDEGSFGVSREDGFGNFDWEVRDKGPFNTIKISYDDGVVEQIRISGTTPMDEAARAIYFQELAAQSAKAQTFKATLPDSLWGFYGRPLDKDEGQASETANAPVRAYYYFHEDGQVAKLSGKMNSLTGPLISLFGAWRVEQNELLLLEKDGAIRFTMSFDHEEPLGAAEMRGAELSAGAQDAYGYNRSALLTPALTAFIVNNARDGQTRYLRSYESIIAGYSPGETSWDDFYGDQWFDHEPRMTIPGVVKLQGKFDDSLTITLGVLTGSAGHKVNPPSFLKQQGLPVLEQGMSVTYVPGYFDNQFNRKNLVEETCVLVFVKKMLTENSCGG